MQSFKAKEKARRYALQALYSWQLSENSPARIETHFLALHNPKKFDVAYFRQLLHSISTEVASLEAALADHLDRPIEQVDPVARNVLRIAAYELTQCFEVPYRVVINEALQLTKTFGATDSYRFVNGVLDSMAQQYRELEKSQSQCQMHGE